MSSPRRFDLAIAGAVLALGLVTAGVAWTLPAGRQDGDIGPGGFPLLIASALVVLGTVRLLQAWRSDPEPSPASRPLPVIAMLATGIAVVVLMPVIGFVPAAAVLLAAGALIAGERRPVRLALFAVVFSLASYALFAFVFAVRLPNGLLEGLLG
ncbi:hypothetical protein HDA32_003511 [Spinactinospora alkalitolerans]|uniref:DUF1468 domain-containing protein n=1 Tax=Spinactinospora alkalitolerans TaxID=687207 RepID=A0A852TXC4_9ACTN|nr:tripartite tricarboxylate transporter TctB family protein [Spinactinospora alkalitolerans]NYE48391.1 hypothetical protein [Spinactinospora alkalitolerans]